MVIKMGNIVCVNVDVSEFLPTKEDAYVSYSNSKKSFYVSTTEEDEYHGYITMDKIVDLFIEGYEQGRGGLISQKDAHSFLNDLESAINKIKSRLER